MAQQDFLGLQVGSEVLLEKKSQSTTRHHEKNKNKKDRLKIARTWCNVLALLRRCTSHRRSEYVSLKLPCFAASSTRIFS
jgi:hypothetical protein